nr:UDP-glucuronate 4-epimerase 1 [Tanacetum cinerariifolium]
MPYQLEEELFPSTPGKIKSDRNHHRTFQRCFTSTSTMFLWALFLIALTASYLAFLTNSNRYLCHNAVNEKIRSSAEIRRSKGMSVLVTGAAGFVGSHVALALKKRGDGVV